MPDPFVEYLRTRARNQYDTVVDVYAGPVYRLLRRLLPPADVEETAQEVFLKLAATRKPAEEVTQPKAFILRLAFHVARHRARADRIRARHESNAGRLRQELSPDASEEAILRERVSQILAAINALPDTLRMPIHLRAVEGLSYRQISQVLGVSVETVGVRILRARKKLRKSLGASFGLTWLVGPPWRPEISALSAARIGEEDGSRIGVSGRKAARVASRSVSVRLPMGMGIVCLCIGVLGFFFAGGASRFSAREVAQASLVAERERNPVLPASSASQKDSQRARLLRRRSFVRNPTASSSLAHVSRADETLSEEKALHPHSREGDPDMKLQASSVAPIMLALGISAAGGGAEMGDFDGDGRLSVRDVKYLLEGHALAPGSLEKFPRYGCSDAINNANPDYYNQHLPGIVYLEALRRSVDGSYPGWVNYWPETQRAAPLPADARVRVDVKSTVAHGGGDDRALIELMLTVNEPLAAFSLILDSESGLLRAPFSYVSELPRSGWSSMEWFISQYVFGEFNEQASGDIAVGISPQTYLVSGGRLVLQYGLLKYQHVIPPGQYSIVVQARLPRAARAGSYKLEVLNGSEVVLADGSLLSPAISAPGFLSLETDVATGWDEGLPPLRFDATRRQVLGKVEFRVVDEGGSPSNPGEPLKEVVAGDSLTLKVQLRTEVPLNDFKFRLELGPGLLCDGFTSLFISPEDNVPYVPQPDALCWGGNGGALVLGFQMAGAMAGFPVANRTTYPDRALEHFKPLNEWTDVCELALRIARDVAAGEEPYLRFEFQPDKRGHEYVAFVPYEMDWPICGAKNRQPEEVHWNYDIVHHDTFLTVLRDTGAECPGDLGIVLDLRDAQGNPGDLVRVPVFAQASEYVNILSLALLMDPAALQIEGFELPVLNRVSKQMETYVVPRGVRRDFCPPIVNGNGVTLCLPSIPFRVELPEVEDQFLLLRIVTSSGTDNIYYPGEELQQLGSLLVRIQETDASESWLDSGTVTWLNPDTGATEEVRSGGEPYPGEHRDFAFSCADVTPAKITIRPRSFVRGDSNGDGKVDLSDAVATLGHLFVGNVDLGCLDAADADDSGKVEITDAIFFLGALFLGTKAIPEPYPACGRDPTADNLGCSQGCQ